MKWVLKAVLATVLIVAALHVEVRGKSLVLSTAHAEMGLPILLGLAIGFSNRPSSGGGGGGGMGMLGEEGASQDRSECVRSATAGFGSGLKSRSKVAICRMKRALREAKEHCYDYYTPRLASAAWGHYVHYSYYIKKYNEMTASEVGELLDKQKARFDELKHDGNSEEEPERKEIVAEIAEIHECFPAGSMQASRPVQPSYSEKDDDEYDEASR